MLEFQQELRIIIARYALKTKRALKVWHSCCCECSHSLVKVSGAPRVLLHSLSFIVVRGSIDKSFVIKTNCDLEWVPYMICKSSLWRIIW